MYKFTDEKEFAFTWTSNGLAPDGTSVEVTDAIAVPNAGMWLPKVIQNIVKEAAEPLLVGASLLTRVEYHYGQTITFPAIGALDAADIGEGQAYPERQIAMGGATVTANIGKSGLAIKITEEMLRYSQFDVINMHLRASGRALARHKEKKIFNFIRAMGMPIFDNLNPTSAMFGVTHGRGIQGSANGSVIMDDIFDAYAQILMNGFTPNTLLMHPLTWSMFVKDPVMRAMMLAGAGSTFFATWTGNPAGRAPWDNSNQGKLGYSAGQDITPGENAGGQTPSALEQYSQQISPSAQLPGYFPFPFRIIVSPFVRFDPRTKLTDVMLFDSAELGALIVDEDIMTDEWNDQSVDIRKIKMKERYGIGIFNEGMAIGVLRNVKVVPNEIVLPAQATIDNAGTFGTIPPTTPVV